ncbi:hypothetical protein [Morganella morganii]|uniref:hypothetical protein n=1 Tax=Morganella morganii TaxID=582 RepID=UPI001F09045A|nr:hypothetical protein [Morganella morganii]
MQTAAPAPVTRTGGEEQLLLAEVHALCERNELMLIDYNPDAVRVAAAQQPRRDIVSAIRFLAGKRVDIELWHSEKLAYCRRLPRLRRRIPAGRRRQIPGRQNSNPPLSGLLTS